MTQQNSAGCTVGIEMVTVVAGAFVAETCKQLEYRPGHR